MFRTDICIAGAGIIGLSLALELRDRGLSVIVLDAAEPLREASTAAAGMLAADDPHNPSELSVLSHLSSSLYPAYLDRIAQFSGVAIPFQTELALQSLSNAAEPEVSRPIMTALTCTVEDATSLPAGFKILPERSIDPRQLASSLLKAISATSINLFAREPVVKTQHGSNSVTVATPTRTIEATHFVDCTGAWANDPLYSVVPIKGQMLAVALPADFPLKITVRTRDIYIVPRTTGPSAGRVIIGATVEDAGFDKTVHAAQIDVLHRQASVFLPQLAHATVLESWSGLRPATPDRLPILGPHPSKPRHWIATGHYRNGILLAPATARVMAQLILGHAPAVPLDAFRPSRATLQKTLT
jgi:glycine oxidase